VTQVFKTQLEEVEQQMQSLRVETPQVEAYKKWEDGKSSLTSRRPGWCVDAYEIFKPYHGSEEHYQAASIIQNKIRWSAWGLLVAQTTVLNFVAIIARLDCTYADKTSLLVLRQGLETVRQCKLSLMQYYDDVEKRLTFITNKIVSTHEPDSAILFNTEVTDALHAFIAGLRSWEG